MKIQKQSQMILCFGWICFAIFTFISLGFFFFLGSKFNFSEIPIHHIAPAIVGTLSAAGLALLFATPAALLLGTYLSFRNSNIFARIISGALQVLAGAPSILVGILGIIYIKLMQSVFTEFRSCLFVASLSLALLILPALAIGVRGHVDSLRELVLDDCEALGLYWWQSLTFVFFAGMLSKLFDSLATGFARACEDTAVVMLTGAALNVGFPQGVFFPFETLSFQIFYLLNESRTMQDRELLFQTSGILLFVVITILGISKGIFYASNRKNSFE